MLYPGEGGGEGGSYPGNTGCKVDDLTLDGLSVLHRATHTLIHTYFLDSQRKLENLDETHINIHVWKLKWLMSVVISQVY